VFPVVVHNLYVLKENVFLRFQMSTFVHKEGLCVSECVCKSMRACIPEAECIINGSYYENSKHCIHLLSYTQPVWLFTLTFFPTPQFVHCLFNSFFLNKCRRV